MCGPGRIRTDTRAILSGDALPLAYGAVPLSLAVLLLEFVLGEDRRDIDGGEYHVSSGFRERCPLRVLDYAVHSGDETVRLELA